MGTDGELYVDARYILLRLADLGDGGRFLICILVDRRDRFRVELRLIDVALMRPLDRPIDRPIDRLLVRPIDRLMDRLIDRLIDRLLMRYLDVLLLCATLAALTVRFRLYRTIAYHIARYCANPFHQLHLQN